MNAFTAAANKVEEARNLIRDLAEDTDTRTDEGAHAYFDLCDIRDDLTAALDKMVTVSLSRIRIRFPEMEAHDGS